MKLPDHGTVLGFQTEPAFEWDPPTDRFGAMKVLGVDQWGNQVVAVLDGVFNAMPTLADVADLPILTLHRFSFRGKPAVHGTSAFDRTTQEQLTSLGLVDLTDEERSLAANCMSITAPSTCMADLESEWRWEHDRGNYEASHERRQVEEEARRRQEAERYETRLKGLTWAQLCGEKHFVRWTPSPPFPSAQFTARAEAQIALTIAKLEDLGAKPKKRDARAVLRSCVLWFNGADAAAGFVIETEEREDVMRVLEELAFVARQPSLLQEVDSWRDW